MSDSVKSIKTYKSPITGRTYTKIVYKQIKNSEKLSGTTNM